MSISAKSTFAVFVALSISFYGLVHYVRRPKKEVATVIRLKEPNKCCRLGEPIIVKTAIYNPMSTPVNFVKRGQSYDFVVIHENGVQLNPKHQFSPQQGSSPPPDAGGTGITTAYPRQKSGEDEIDLSEWYDFSQSGTYEVKCLAIAYKADYYCKFSEPLIINVRN